MFDWTWDQSAMSPACDLSTDKLTVNFHSSYSSGTAAVRGMQPMTDAQYFFEVKMKSPVYGTDMVRIQLKFCVLFMRGFRTCAVHLADGRFRS